jgi:uncharacterized membrane protein
MTKSSRILAFLAYLIPVLGWLYVLLAHRQDRFAAYHARQAVVLTAASFVALLGWVVGAWLVTWIPLAGPFVAASLFSLVIALYLVLFAAWIMGMINALRASARLLPVVGSWAQKLPMGG